MVAFETKTALYQHQLNATEKLIESRVGALFMEMGTGKTRTAIEIIKLRAYKISKVVWVCPVSLKETIFCEVKKHTDIPDKEIYIFDTKTDDCNINKSLSFYIVGIESIGQSSRVTLALNRLLDSDCFVIVDESSFIKGHRSKRTERITYLAKECKYRAILTGTPMTQGIVDLYAQMRFLSEKILGYKSFYSFAHNHLEYSDKYPNMIVRTFHEPYLAAKIAPYTYQVTKDECLNLPSKIYDTRYFKMSDEQRDAYDYEKQLFLESIDMDDFSATDIFMLYTTLQQIVSGYQNAGKEFPTYFKENGRISTLNSIIQSIEHNKKIIIWAKYHYDINLIRNLLSDSASYFSGKLSEPQKSDAIKQFKRDKRYFVATPSAGGYGLTLNDAHYVIFYNNSFKYSERLQAEDRCHRIGQKNKVTYIDIECMQSIDGRIASALSKKANVVDLFKKEVEKIKDKKQLEEFINKL